MGEASNRAARVSRITNDTTISVLSVVAATETVLALPKGTAFVEIVVTLGASVNDLFYKPGLTAVTTANGNKIPPGGREIFDVGPTADGTPCTLRFIADAAGPTDVRVTIVAG